VQRKKEKEKDGKRRDQARSRLVMASSMLATLSASTFASATSLLRVRASVMEGKVVAPDR
jgi:hypothetical protein